MKIRWRIIEKDDLDFDKAAKSAEAKRKFMLDRLLKKTLLPDNHEEEIAEEKVQTSV